MASYFQALHFIGLISFIICFYRIMRNSLSVREKQEDDLDHGSVDKLLLERTLKAFARNTSSVIHMYGKLSYFNPFEKDENKDKKSLIGYVSNSKNNIMITDPLCAKEDAKEALVNFTKFAQARGKTSLLFPIDIITARQAAEIGYGILQVGKEPVFDLKIYSPTNLDKKILSAAKQVFSKGIVIESLSFKQIKEQSLEIEMEDVLNEWLLSRHSEKMELLLEVSPFKYNEEKKYFVAKSKNKIEAFLACSPIFGRNGFFIHDLIRRPTSMNGIAEALNIAALTALKAEGYDFASLGTAPLAGLDDKGVNSNYKLSNRFLIHIFNSHKMFMRFKSLYSFKKKFKPTSEEPTFLAFYPPNLKVNDAMTVVGLFSGQGALGDIIFKIKRWLDGEQLPRPLLSILSGEVATFARPVPLTFYEFVSRLKFTFVIFVLNFYTYIETTDLMGDLYSKTLNNYGFNFTQFFAHKWFILFTSNFLHFSFAQLFANTAMLFFFCGTLEFIAGSTIAALAFLVSMDANVPMALLFLPFLKSINFEVWRHIVSYTDVGASLGIMGCLGALIQFIKNKRKVLLLICLITVGVTVFNKELFGIDHTFAVITGYLVGHLYLYQRFRIRGFRRFFVSPDHPVPHNSPIPFRGGPR